MPDYAIPSHSVGYEQIIKKSRFIGYIGHAEDEAMAHAFIQSIRDKFPDARHVCWAFIAGAPGNTTAVSMSDAGEPNGTAGRPMLNVLQHSDVGEIVAVIVRYFGGIKLGTGGLVRAYSSTTTEALKQLETHIKVSQTRMTIDIPYPLENDLRHILEQTTARLVDCQYGEAITFHCDVADDQVESLRQTITNRSKGTAQITTPDTLD